MEPVSTVYKSYGKSGLITVVLLGVGIGLGYLWFVEHPSSVGLWGRWLQFISGALILCAVLGKLGWRFQSYDENTPAEKHNRWVFSILHCAGMFVLFTSSAALIFIGEN